MRRVLLLILLLTLGMAALAEEPAATFEAYFERPLYIRPTPAGSGESLGTIPALTLIELTPVSDLYAQVTWQGRTGYVWYEGALRLPEDGGMAPYVAYLPENKYLFSLPSGEAASLMTVQAETPVTVTADLGRFLRIEVDGRVGYVYARDTVAVDDVPMKVVDRSFRVDAAVAARRYPLRNAPEALTLEPGRIFVAEAMGNGFYRVTLGAETVYVPVKQVVTLEDDGADDRVALITPQTQLFTAPAQSAETEATLPGTRLLLLDPQENGFQRIRGTDWYIRVNDVPLWSAARQEALCLQITADTALLQRPEAGAETVAQVAAGTLYPEVYAVGGWYLLPVEGGWGFLPGDSAAATALETDLAMMRTAAVTLAETAFHGPAGAPETLAAGTRLVITAGAGDFWRVSTADGEGFVRKEGVRILGSDTPLTAYSVIAEAEVAVLDFPDASLGAVVGVLPAGRKLRITGFNRCYLMVTGGGYTGYVRQEGLLTEESRGIPATEDVPGYELVLDKSTGMCYAFLLEADGTRGALVICAEVGIGKRTTPTPAGVFLLGRKERWHAFTYAYTPHTTEYVKARYIHGWPCARRSTASVKEGMIRTGMVTGGCLRSPFDFAEWVYKNCTSYVTRLTIVNGGFEAPEGAEAVQVQ